ncbi:hybrid sensor histidine kinase/response regulator transcription factor [Flammeovirga pacifica]|nr:hybrid sensor histidine kinase/response regulator transcription factor [Flammeovirga pacifica]
MNRIFSIYLYLLFFLITIPIQAQKEGMDYHYIKSFSMAEGMSHYGVTSILEDHLGKIWVGTFDGLNTFDGYDFKYYRNNKHEKLLTSTRVRSLAQDKYHSIWVGTDNGINIFDYEQETIEKFFVNEIDKNFFSGPIIIQILILNDRVYCLSQNDGVYIFDEKTRELLSHLPSTSNLRIHHLCEVGSEVFVGSNKGVYKINVKTNELINVFGKIGLRVLDFTANKQGTLFCLTNNGITIIETPNGKDYKLKGKYFIHRKFLCLDIRNDSELWIGDRERGVYVINIDELLSHETKYSDISIANKIDISRVSYLLPNSKSGSWVGSFDDGLFHLKNYQQVFKNASLISHDQQISSSNQILNVNVYDSSHVLLNVHFRGIINYDIKNEKMCELPQFIQNYKNIIQYSIFVDKKGGSYVKYNSKENYYKYQSKEGNTFKPVLFKDLPELGKMKIRALALDKFGYHWIAANEGLYRIRIGNNGKVRQAEFLKSLDNKHSFKELRSIYIDPKYNFIWVGSKQDGLIRIDNAPKKKLNEMKIAHFVHNVNNNYSLPSNFVSSIVRLPNGDLWLGTETGGICKVENSQLASTFKSFSEEDGLDNNSVKSIQYDEQNNLWITTNKGINQFDLDTYQFRNYSEDDGVLAAPFISTSGKLDNGTLVFGGLNGLCFFDPKEITEVVTLPDFVFGELKIFNQEIHPSEEVNGKTILQKTLNHTDQIELDYEQNVFSIELTSLHFKNPKNNLIKYRLLPQDTEWVVRASDSKEASFNGLPPGKYTFQAAASNSKKEWTPVKELTIIIHPPLWKTVGAYIFYLFVIIVVIIIINRFIIRLNTLKHDLQLEHLERDRVVELNKTRTQMFMNISHEFRTPLTLISGPLQLLIRMFKENIDAFEHLNLIDRQSKKMFQLVNQVQDFQKAEQSLLQLDMQSFEFVELISEIKTDFDQLASQTNKKLKFEGEANQLFIIADRNKLEIIINNLLNNAFKFTKERDEITFSYGIRDEKIFFQVKDSGKGISEDDIPNIFDRYFQSKNYNTTTIGSGIGLAFSKKLVELHYGKITVESVVNQNTIFEVILPVKFSLKDEFNENRYQELLSDETDDDKQKVLPEGIDLPAHMKDESLKSLNVFFVEDNDDLRKFITTSLSEYFNVKQFENGKKCLDQIEEEWPDLIISDILMPEVNGLELANKLKNDVRTSHIPIILLTSRSSIDDRVLGLETGADAYITKPFDLKHLVATAQMLLKNRQKLRERFSIDFPMEVEKKSIDKTDRVFMEKLYELMEDNLDNEDLDISDFIDVLHLNRTHFYQKVKAITNHTPYELLKKYRLKKAAELLVKEKLSVSEVFFKTGFKSRTHFSKMFKEYYGIPPGKYGKQAKLEDK